MSIFNKIQKVFSVAVSPMNADLQRLNTLKSGLGNDAVKYVSKGTHETVLATLSNYAAEGLLDVGESYAREKETKSRRKLIVDLAKRDLDTLSRYICVLQISQNPLSFKCFRL